MDSRWLEIWDLKEGNHVITSALRSLWRGGRGGRGEASGGKRYGRFGNNEHCRLQGVRRQPQITI